jgi:hypothetical protein
MYPYKTKKQRQSMNAKKIRIPLPWMIKHQVMLDIEDFAVSQNRLLNTIFERLHDSDKDACSVQGPFSEVLQFSLSVANTTLWESFRIEQKLENEADFLRRLLFSYCNRPKYLREQLVFHDSMDLIAGALKQQKVLCAQYKEKLVEISPWFMHRSPGETRSYLVGVLKDKSSPKSFRLLHLKPIRISNEQSISYNPDEKDALYRNFDPFLSFGHEVIVRLDEEGQIMLKNIQTNRPKLISSNANDFKFMCSQKLGEVYFAQFLEHAEILHPAELRLKMADRAKRAGGVYLND